MEHQDIMLDPDEKRYTKRYTAFPLVRGRVIY